MRAHRPIAVLVRFLALALLAPAARADNAVPAVRFSKGETTAKALDKGVTLFTNNDNKVSDGPAEVMGLQFTCRPAKTPSEATLDAPAGATAYVLTNSKGTFAACEKDGWTRIKPDVHFDDDGKRQWLQVYKRQFAAAGQFKVATRTYAGCIFAASGLRVGGAATSAPADATDTKPEAVPDDTPGEGPTTRPALEQTSIRALEIYKTASGMMLGQTSEVTLTVTRGERPHAVSLAFATAVGHEMGLARDDMLRYVRLKYPNWYAARSELTFEDKYVNHDGGSIGTALGTLLLSAIEGFALAPDVAMTGDISASGKVQAIGGVSAKIKGAIASKCRLTAVPTDNYDQLVDGVVYNGPSLVLGTQVVGIATLDDAVQTARVGRPERLDRAVEKFAAVQRSATTRPAYLKTRAAAAALADVAELAPQHYSAKLLLAYAQNKLPRTLSATATRYYATLAAEPVLGVLKSRAGEKPGEAVPSTAVKAGIADLEKLRPMANPGVRPLVEDWIKFIEAVDALQSRGGSQQTVERQRHALLDEFAREQSDADMMQKMLKEGM